MHALVNAAADHVRGLGSAWILFDIVPSALFPSGALPDMLMRRRSRASVRPAQRRPTATNFSKASLLLVHESEMTEEGGAM